MMMLLRRLCKSVRFVNFKKICRFFHPLYFTNKNIDDNTAENGRALLLFSLRFQFFQVLFVFSISLLSHVWLLHHSVRTCKDEICLISLDFVTNRGNNTVLI